MRIMRLNVNLKMEFRTTSNYNSFVIYLGIICLSLCTLNTNGFAFHEEWCTRTHCYQWQNEAKTWQEAKQLCAQNGGHLANIRDFGAHHLAEAAMKWNGDDMIWIGATLKKTSECGVMTKIRAYDGSDHTRRRRHAPRGRERPPWLGREMEDSDDPPSDPEPEWTRLRGSREWTLPWGNSDPRDEAYGEPRSERGSHGSLARTGSRDVSPEASGEQPAFDWKYETRSCFIDLPITCLYQRASAWETCMPSFSSCGDAYCAKVDAETPVTWLEARQMCHGYDGSLPNVTSRERVDQWLAVVPCSEELLREVDQTWTSKTGIELEWVSGETVTFSAWSWKHPPHEPVEGCVAMSSRSGWLDYNCDSKFPFICETVKTSDRTTPAASIPAVPDRDAFPRRPSPSPPSPKSAIPPRRSSDPGHSTRSGVEVTLAAEKTTARTPFAFPGIDDREDIGVKGNVDDQEERNPPKNTPESNSDDSGLVSPSVTNRDDQIGDRDSGTDINTDQDNPQNGGTADEDDEVPSTSTAGTKLATSSNPVTTTVTETIPSTQSPVTEADTADIEKDSSGFAGSDGREPHQVGINEEENVNRKQGPNTVDKEVSDSALNAEGTILAQHKNDGLLGVYIGVPLLVVFLVLLVAILSMRARQVNKARQNGDPVNMDNPNYDTEVSSTCAVPTMPTMARPGLDTLDNMRNPNVIHVHKPLAPMDGLKCWNLYQTLDSVSSEESVPRGPMDHHYASLDNETNFRVEAVPCDVIRGHQGGPYIQEVILGNEEGDYAELDVTATSPPLQPSAPPHHANSTRNFGQVSPLEVHPGTSGTVGHGMIGRARMPEPHLGGANSPVQWKYSYDIPTITGNGSNQVIEEDTSSQDPDYVDYDIAHYDKADDVRVAPSGHILRNRDSVLVVDNDLYHTGQRN